MRTPPRCPTTTELPAQEEADGSAIVTSTLCQYRCLSPSLSLSVSHTLSLTRSRSLTRRRCTGEGSLEPLQYSPRPPNYLGYDLGSRAFGVDSLQPLQHVNISRHHRITSRAKPNYILGCRWRSVARKTTRTVEHDPFIKRQLASRNQLEGLMWFEFGDVPRGFQGG